ncbi:MAG: glycosyltransferase family 2 protein [Rikenellaceae bacterium]
MKKIDVSVIIPVYGVEGYIERSLRSLFTQSKTDGVEYILVNDATLDTSMDIARQVISEYKDLEIKIIDHAENRGLALARQTGLESATGEYILHTDSDDWCESTMLEDMYQAAVQSGADVVVCDYFLNISTQERYISQKVSSDPIEFYDMILKGDAAPSVWNKLVRRSIIIDNNIKPVADINMGEDQIFTAKVLCQARPKVYHLSRAYHHYCIRETSYMGVVREHYLLQSVAGTNIVEQIIRDENLTAQLMEGLMVKKLRVKLKVLLNSTKEKQREYLSLYSEADGYILTHTPAKKIYRYALQQAVSGRLWIFRGIVAMLNLAHKLKR